MAAVDIAVCDYFMALMTQQRQYQPVDPRRELYQVHVLTQVLCDTTGHGATLRAGDPVVTTLQALRTAMLAHADNALAVPPITTIPHATVYTALAALESQVDVRTARVRFLAVRMPATAGTMSSRDQAVYALAPVRIRVSDAVTGLATEIAQLATGLSAGT